MPALHIANACLTVTLLHCQRAEYEAALADLRDENLSLRAKAGLEEESAEDADPLDPLGRSRRAEMMQSRDEMTQGQLQARRIAGGPMKHSSGMCAHPSLSPQHSKRAIPQPSAPPGKIK